MRREFESESEINYARYSPIKIVDAVHHRVRESTDAVLQIGKDDQDEEV